MSAEIREASPTRAQPTILLQGGFSPKLRIYMFAYWTAIVVLSIVGIILLPLWLVLGPIWIRRYHAALRCDLTERSVIVGKGLVFRRELTIPLDKIQDISIREGPLLSAFGLLQLRIETAGQSNSSTGQSDADLVGLIDARDVRDRILEQRDMLTSTEKEPSVSESGQQVLIDIRDSLLRLERAIEQRQRSGPSPN